ncbi:hypothetical protein A7X85_00075 [Streptomyces sp. ST1015]|nr:hypothetical protein A7X85_00075 [Streptomyces sp. ST1015]
MFVLVGAAGALGGVHLSAVRRTAGASLAGAVVLVVAVATGAAVRGEPAHFVVGVALTVGGVVAVVWAVGRSRRRRSARRGALADYEAGAAVVPLFAALAERERLAVELHDVAAHRLTGIVVGAGAALRLGDPERAGEALRHAGVAGRAAVRELERLSGLDGPAAGFAEVDALAAAQGVDYRRTVDGVPAGSAQAAYRVVREALTNAARYAAGAAVRLRIEPVGGRAGGERMFVVTVTDDGGRPPSRGSGPGVVSRGWRPRSLRRVGRCVRGRMRAGRAGVCGLCCPRWRLRSSAGGPCGAGRPRSITRWWRWRSPCRSARVSSRPRLPSAGCCPRW